MILDRYVVHSDRVERVTAAAVQRNPIRHRVLTLQGDEILVTTNRGDHVFGMSVAELVHLADVVRRDERRRRRFARLRRLLGR